MAKTIPTESDQRHSWSFATRFKCNGFGWRSDLPIQRIKEALAEIKQVGKKDAVLAAEGALLLLGKLSPALMNVDSSSGALGSWVNRVNRVIETLVPVIATAPVTKAMRKKWM